MEILEIGWAHLCYFCITIVQTVRVDAYKRGIETSAECIHLLVFDCLPHSGLFTNPIDRSLGHRCRGAAHEGAYKQPNPTHRDLPRSRVRTPPPNGSRISCGRLALRRQMPCETGHERHGTTVRSLGSDHLPTAASACQAA